MGNRSQVDIVDCAFLETCESNHLGSGLFATGSLEGNQKDTGHDIGIGRHS